MSKRLCACGCGEEIVEGPANKMYVNRTHQLRGPGGGAATVESAVEMSERFCACGCGEKITPGPANKLYVNRTHQIRGPGGGAATVESAVESAVESSKLREVRAQNALLTRELADVSKLLDRFTRIHHDDLTVPAWVREIPTGKAHHATPVLMLSDLHLDEVVDRYEMDGINEYDRQIAEQRLERVVNGAVKLLRRYVSGVHFDGIVVPLLGDVVTGDIHEELARTNEAPTPASVVHWVPRLASALTYLADEMGRVHVPAVDGNHDRTYKRTPKKKRAEASFAWVIYNWLADTLRHDERITFSITTSPEQLVDVYDTSFLLSHGDGFRSAGGVGGLYPALLKWLLRRHDLYSQTRRDFDYALLGHWHQDLWGQDFVVNGSLKGYDEYAKDGGFKFAAPAQQLFVVTPERGVTQRLTVFAS